jgi:succinate dehydrogenase / fumarate reductase flavoprotein subunit
VLLATGGAGRIFAASTNAFINTGDGLGMAARAGIPLQDMEFWQFHPTGVAGAGVLLTEGCRGEGAILLNSNGERFMERYAPTLKDLAPRDFVSRSHGPGDQGRPWLRARTRTTCCSSSITLAPRPSTSACPRCTRSVTTSPTSTSRASRSRSCPPSTTRWAASRPTSTARSCPEGRRRRKTVVNGLYAVGECSCVSVHGANRLGTNSLLDLLVFGKAAGNHIVEFAQRLKHKSHKDAAQGRRRQDSLARLARLDGSKLRRVRAGRGQRHPRHHAAARRRVPHPGQLMDEGVQKINADLRERVSRIIGLQGQVQGVQHRAHRGAGSREPDGRPPRPP